MSRRWAEALGAALSATAVLAAWRLQLAWPGWSAVMITSVAVGALAEWLWPKRGAGLVVGGLFASMPLVQLNAATLPVLQILVSLAWLAGVAAFERTGQTRWLAVAAAVLAAGAAASGTAFISMPVLAAGSVLALALIAEPARVPPRTLIVPIAVGAAALLPFAFYLWAHPEWLVQRAAAYSLYDTDRFNVRQGAREIISWVGLTARSETYWHYLDPVFLFSSAGSGARQAPVFLLSAAVLLPLGLARATAPPVRRLPALMIAGLLAAPLAGALLVLPPEGRRFASAAPFAALLMFVGLNFLMVHGRRLPLVLGRLLSAALLANAMVFALTAGS